jgi:hypothetical protein
VLRYKPGPNNEKAMLRRRVRQRLEPLIFMVA